MKVRWIDSEGVSVRELAELPALRNAVMDSFGSTFPSGAMLQRSILASEFHFHSMAIAESKARNHVPRVHVYPDHVSSSSCTRQRLAQAATCTISNWTNLLASTFWSPSMDPSAPRCRSRRPCARRAQWHADGKRTAAPDLPVRTDLRDRFRHRSPGS